MKRRDKVGGVARYLTGATGIVGIRATATKEIEAPLPYHLSVSVNRVLHHWYADIKAMPATGIHACIRYDGGIQTVAEAWVGMRLDHFATLLKAHHDMRGER